MIFDTSKNLYEHIKEDHERHKKMEEYESGDDSKKTYHAETLRRSFAFGYFSKWRDRITDKYVHNKEWVDKYFRSVDFTKFTKKHDFNKEFPKKDHPDKPDKYGIICAAYKLFENGDIDIDKYKSVFIYVAEKEGGTKKIVKNVKKEDKRAVIDEAYEELSYKLLCDDVIGERLSKEFNEDRFDVINLLYEYCKHKGIDGTNVRNALSDEYINKCQKLFELLLESGSDEVIVPLYVDPSSGAGVYIIGSDHLKLSEEDKARLPGLKNYGVYTVSYSESVGYDDYYEIADGSVNSINMLFKHELKRFESVKDAFVDLTVNYEDEYYYGYKGVNDAAFYAPVKEKLGEVNLLRCFELPSELPQEKGKTMNERAVNELKNDLAETMAKYQ